MMSRNCPNCGAPFTLDSIKCEYCGTLSLDLTGLDLSENTPVFIRYKIPHGSGVAYVTQLAIPHLESITVNRDTTDFTDCSGRILKRYYNNSTAVTNLRFDAIPFGNNHILYQVNIEEK